MSYIVVGMFDTPNETANFAHYLATKFVRFLVLQRKNTQDVRADRFRFVPMMDMTREWTDADLYSKYGLSASEIEFVEKIVRPMDLTSDLLGDVTVDDESDDE